MSRWSPRHCATPRASHRILCTVLGVVTHADLADIRKSDNGCTYSKRHVNHVLGETTYIACTCGSQERLDVPSDVGHVLIWSCPSASSQKRLHPSIAPSDLRLPGRSRSIPGSAVKAVVSMSSERFERSGLPPCARTRCCTILNVQATPDQCFDSWSRADSKIDTLDRRILPVISFRSCVVRGECAPVASACAWLRSRNESSNRQCGLDMKLTLDVTAASDDKRDIVEGLRRIHERIDSIACQNYVFHLLHKVPP